MKERDLQRQKKVADVDVSLRDKLRGLLQEARDSSSIREFKKFPAAMAKGTLCRTMAHPASRASFISFLRAVAVHVRYK